MKQFGNGAASHPAARGTCSLELYKMGDFCRKQAGTRKLLVKGKQGIFWGKLKRKGFYHCRLPFLSLGVVKGLYSRLPMVLDQKIPDWFVKIVSERGGNCSLIRY